MDNTITVNLDGVDVSVQRCDFYKDHKGIYSSFRLPGTRGSVNITNKMFVGGVVPAFILVSTLVPANSEVPTGDAEKAAAKAEAARVKAEAAQAKANQRAEKAQAAAEKAKAAAEAALARATKAAEAAKASVGTEVATEETAAM